MDMNEEDLKIPKGSLVNVFDTKFKLDFPFEMKKKEFDYRQIEHKIVHLP